MHRHHRNRSGTGTAVRTGALIAAMCGLLASRALAQTCEEGLRPSLYERLLNRHFSSLLSSQSGAILGNFAAIDVKEAEATFAGTTIFRSGAVLATRVRGGATDGLIPILRGSDFSPKLGATVQLNLLRHRSAISFDCTSYLKYRETMRRIDRDHALRLAEIEDGRNYAETLKTLQLAALNRRAGELAAALRVATGATKDSLAVELARVEKDRELKRAEEVPAIEVQQFTLDQLRATKLRQAEDSLDVLGFSLGWVSAEYGVENVAFRLLDPALPVADQVTKRSYATHSGGLRYSRYRFSPGPFETRFWSVSVLVSQDHNLGDLTKVEVTDRQSFEASPGERVVENKYTAYAGEYRSNLSTLTLGADYYQFLFNKNQAAVHIYPTIELKESQRTSYNLGLGFLITARNTTKEASTLNAELFLDLTDLTDARNSDEGLLGRSGLGLRLTFPITFRQEI